MHKQITSTLISNNACYHCFQKLLSTTLSPKNIKMKIHRKTVTLNVGLHDCATWTVKLREEHKLTLFENRVLEKLLWPKKEVRGDWRKLHNEELHDLYWSPDNIGMIIRQDVMGGKRVIVHTGFGGEN